jgi:thiamine-phosphate pyrophosphorylase
MKLRFELVLVTDSKLMGVAETLARLRVMSLDPRVAVELREKSMATRALVDFAMAARELTARQNAVLIVNDRVDVALLAKADGVHLPACGLPADSVRRLTDKALLVGRSIHAPGEVSCDGADFVRFGPVFETPSKAHFGAPQGIARLREVVAAAGRCPVFAVGGIDLERIPVVRSAGAHGVAVIRDWLTARDPARWLSEALECLRDPA